MTAERIAELRFDKTLREPMSWMFECYGEALYQKDSINSLLKNKEKEILKGCEDNEIEFNAKQRKKLLDSKLWQKHAKLVETAHALMQVIGDKETSDFNNFKAQVDKTLKAEKIKLTASEKNTILGAVSWYDENAEKVIKKTEKLKGDKLQALLEKLGCKEKVLPDYGYYPLVSGQSEHKGEYVTYESNANLRDSESIPLKDDIFRYFLAEVKPHVDEAWINIGATKIGYEISFNKYFYQYKPLRSMEEVAREIIELEKQAEGLIADILGIEVEAVSGVEND